MGLLQWSPEAPPKSLDEQASQWEPVITVADNEELIDALRPVWRLSGLAPNWDSYGSPAISQSAILRAALMVIATVERSSPKPNVVPVPGGGVQLEWAGPGGELEIECSPTGAISYLFERPDGTASDGILDAAEYRRMLQALVQETFIHPAAR
jgi:hypothetical protein